MRVGSQRKSDLFFRKVFFCPKKKRAGGGTDSGLVATSEYQLRAKFADCDGKGRISCGSTLH
jgi:hypothetical protein